MSFSLKDLERRARRQSAERRFRAYGIIALGVAAAMLLTLFFTIFTTGISAFWRYETAIEFTLDAKTLKIDPTASYSEDEYRSAVRKAPYSKVIKNAVYGLFPDVKKRKQKIRLAKMVSYGAESLLRDTLMSGDAKVGDKIKLWVPLSDDLDTFLKGNIDASLPEKKRRVKDIEMSWLETLESEGSIRQVFDWGFFVRADSREPEIAGLGGAIKGSFYLLLVTFMLSVPIGVMAAIYLEEFARKNKFTDFIEININNLAAVPSIIFGLLGLAMFLNFLGFPRSAPLVGGMVLSLMTLPTVIIASRNAIAAVPPTLREAAIGLGASPMQTVLHHVLPVAMPGIITGTILGLARALGETAPLIMIGMVAFIASVPDSIVDPSTALPVQIYLWVDSPERAFVAKSNAAIMVMLAFLLVMNGTAAYLRYRAENR